MSYALASEYYKGMQYSALGHEKAVYNTGIYSSLLFINT